MGIQSWFESALSPECVFCGKRITSQIFCSHCDPRLEIGDKNLCLRCGNPLTHESVQCGECRSWPWVRDLTCRSQFTLSQRSRWLIHQAKLFRSPHFYRFLMDGVSLNISEATLVPVPLHIGKLCQRGFNQSLLIARWLSRNSGLRVTENQLIKVKSTANQSGLNRRSRGKNLKGAFRWEGALDSNLIVLIDDVYTTGSTLREAARTIRRQGRVPILGWTLFRRIKPLLLA